MLRSVNDGVEAMTDADQHEATNNDGDTESRQQSGTINNTVNAETVSGLVVQGGVITGGVHQHLPAQWPPVPTPRQLLPAPAGFVGRFDHLAALDRALTRSSADGGEVSGATAVISAIGGTGGIGKTWLALTWAHRNLDRFPDGQLSVDLRGFSSGEPRHVTDVLADFLAALGVDRDHQPASLDARIALYRTHTTGKHLLILLDNAATTDQVEPLLPGGNTCTVIVTSRHRLPALITRHGARAVRVDVLTDPEARTLLTAALSDTRTTASADRAVSGMIALCSGFPLALGLVAASIRTHPDLLDEIVTELRELGLDALQSDDPAASLPAVLSWSLRYLTEQQRMVLGLLGVAPGPDISLPAAASLTGQPESQVRKALRVLEEASLLDRHPGGRYSMHDLIRAYATNTAHRELTERAREAALRRVVDFYLHTAHPADRLLDPHRPPVLLDPPAPGCLPHPLPDDPAALAWFDVEHACLLAAQRAAATHEWHQAVWHLAWALYSFHWRRGHRHHRVTVWRAGLGAAEHLADPTTRTRAHRYLGRAYAGIGRHDEAIWHLCESLALAEQHRDSTHQAHTHRALGWVWGQRRDDRQALEHATRALTLSHTVNNPVWEADALIAVGWFAARLGEYERGREHCYAALALHRRHHNPYGEANTLHRLGYINYHTGHHQQAVDHYQQALTLSRDLGDTDHVPDALDGLGHPLVALGQPEQARAVWQKALELYREQGRNVDTERVQQQLDHLDNPSDAGDGLRDVS